MLAGRVCEVSPPLWKVSLGTHERGELWDAYWDAYADTVSVLSPADHCTIAALECHLYHHLECVHTLDQGTWLLSSQGVMTLPPDASFSVILGVVIAL